MMIDISPRGNGKTTRLIERAKQLASTSKETIVILTQASLADYYNKQKLHPNLEFRGYGSFVGGTLAGKPNKTFIDNLDLFFASVRGSSKTNVIYATLEKTEEWKEITYDSFQPAYDKDKLVPLEASKDVSEHRVVVQVMHWCNEVKPTSGSLLKRLNYHVRKELHPKWLVDKLLDEETDNEYTASQRAALVYKLMVSLS